jgi:hypothetical protein
MTPFRGHAGPQYRVYSEGEFLGLAEYQPELSWPRREAPVGARRTRTSKRSAGAAVTTVSLWWAAPATGAALLAAAAGITAALTASANHARRPAAGGWDDRGSLLALSLSVIAGSRSGPTAARAKRPDLRTPRTHQQPGARAVRASRLAGRARSRPKQTRSRAVAGSGAGAGPRGALISQASGARAPEPPVAPAHDAAAPGSAIGTPGRARADFTFER